MTSDSAAVEDIMMAHKYAKSKPEAVADAVNAGCDVISAGWKGSQVWSTNSWYITDAKNAIDENLMTEAALNVLVTRALKMRFMLGLFDPIEDQPYWHVPPEAVHSDSHVAAAKDATAQSLVLIQNPHAILPFKAGATVAIIGPHAKAQGILLANYISQICPG